MLMVVFMNHLVMPVLSYAAEPQFLSLRLGFTAGTLYDVDINDARAAQEIWLRSVLKSINQNTKSTNQDDAKIEAVSIYYPNISIAQQALLNQEVDVIVLLPIEYLAIQNKTSIVPILTSQSGRDGDEHYVLISYNPQNEIQQIEQLGAQKLFISTQKDNKIPQMWLDTLLNEQALPTIENFFSEIEYVNKSTKAILAIFFKKSGVCLVPKTDFEIACELNPQLKRHLQIIHQSPGYNRSIVCVPKTLYKTHGELLARAIAIVNETTQGQQLLKLFRVTTLQYFENTHLDNLRNLQTAYQAIIQKQNVSPP